PKQGVLRTRVSRAIATARVTSQPSDQTVTSVDSGLVSPAKTQRPSRHTTRDARRRGFFVARAMAGGQARCFPESDPARLARRRLAAGPTPAALLPTGQ